MQDFDGRFCLEQQFTESVPHLDLVDGTQDFLHLLDLRETTSPFVVLETSFPHQIFSHSFLQGTPLMVTASYTIPVGMVVHTGFGCDNGPGTATIVLILDCDEAGPMTREILFLLLDTAVVVSLETPSFGDLGIDEDSPHLTTILQFPLGLLGLGNLGSNLLPCEKLAISQCDMDGIH